MLIQSIHYLLDRDLSKLQQEIESYSKEENLWIIDQNIENSAGNLCLHIIGNLKTYIGAALGNTGYIRHRDAEFSLKNIARKELLEAIEETKTIIKQSLDTLTEDDLKQIYPQELGYPIKTVSHLLVHLTIHLGYHLGQINYHRRILDL